jgi:hypothetical protein
MTRGAQFEFGRAERPLASRHGRRTSYTPGRRMRTSYVPLVVAVLGLLFLAALSIAWTTLVPGDPMRSRVPVDAWRDPPAVEPVELMPIQPDAARQVNEKRPFDIAGPIPAAPPFHFSGTELSRGRAMACLAAAGWYEAGDDVLGEQSVLQVVLNRARHPAFPRTICGVVFQGSERTTGCQFTFSCDGSLQRRKPSATAWARAMALASSMLDGHVDPRVGIASHYHADWVVPYWAPTLVKLAQVRTHIFYSWKGKWGSPRALLAASRAEEPGIAALAGLSTAHMPLAGTVVTTEPGTKEALAETAPPAAPAGVGDRALRGAIVRADEASAGKYFIQVDPGTFAGNHAVAALALCKSRPSCRVYGWRDAGSVAGALPLSGKQLDQLTFFYSHEEGRADQALWDCGQIPRTNKTQCLPSDSSERAALIG